MLNIYSVRNRQIYNPQVNFKGFEGASTVNGRFCVHETRFLRNYPTLDFVKKYLTRVFPYGTHIAEFGCSQGQKPYSLMALLADENRDKRYTITGYDLAPKVVAKARKGEFDVHQQDSEKIFWDDGTKYFEYQDMTKEQISDARRKFDEYFSKDDDPYDGGIITLKVKPEKVKGVVDFKVGDVQEIDKIYSSPKKKKPGVVIFQNALYHLLGNWRDSGKYGYTPELESVKKLFEKIHGLLPENGLFVMGNLPSDNMFNRYNPESNKTRLTYQDGQRIEVFDSSPVHETLRQVGFEPVFYECYKDKDDEKLCYEEVGNFPSVWKKVSKK